MEADDKPAWRAHLRAARAAVPSSVRAAEASALSNWMRSLRGTVCAYWPVGTEPGSVAMLSALVEAGCRVLLPVVPSGRPGPLEWAFLSDVDAVTVGRFGLVEPPGRRLGADAIGQASTVLVPALAVDRCGVRLGRGGGYYDRSLTMTRAGTELVAVVRDDELVRRLPAEPHDVRMTAALTPSGGFVRLGDRTDTR